MLTAASLPFALLLTDVVMPGIDGHRLYERLRARQPDLRVLYTSGYPDVVLAERGAVLEKKALLSKPYTPEQLARRVRERLDSQ